jgi:hypothetical protein
MKMRGLIFHDRRSLIAFLGAIVFISASLYYFAPYMFSSPLDGYKRISTELKNKGEKEPKKKFDLNGPDKISIWVNKRYKQKPK